MGNKADKNLELSISKPPFNSVFINFPSTLNDVEKGKIEEAITNAELTFLCNGFNDPDNAGGMSLRKTKFHILKRCDCLLF